MSDLRLCQRHISAVRDDESHGASRVICEHHHQTSKWQAGEPESHSAGFRLPMVTGRVPGGGTLCHVGANTKVCRLHNGPHHAEPSAAALIIATFSKLAHKTPTLASYYRPSLSLDAKTPRGSLASGCHSNRAAAGILAYCKPCLQVEAWN